MGVIGLLMLVIAPFYWKLPSPERDHESPLLPRKTEEPKYISTTTNYLMGINFYFLVGQYTTYGGWAASYAVLQGFSSK